jgi:hypothetical protein
MVKPSQYLPTMFGEKMELPYPQTAERVLSFLHSLHNQLAEMVEDNQESFGAIRGHCTHALIASRSNQIA